MAPRKSRAAEQLARQLDALEAVLPEVRAGLGDMSDETLSRSFALLKVAVDDVNRAWEGARDAFIVALIEKQHSHREVAKLLGVSRPRISQILARHRGK